ncbi:hypothetical protein VNO78_07699 [Psophocarpus tetragonolobus]|uniref:Late embryogenesis abundant protein LEA-2 subgroup domain-containing protein n=1 Tax=Psophocarpus tetragonolobus TaxID=3891 RepID=A0AAN9SV23_PSOTE
MSNRTRKERSGKCFVYVLATFVMLFALVLVFACVVRVRNPHLELTSATFNNATLLIVFTIYNPNFGPFYYHHCSLSVLYAGATIANSIINGGAVDFRQTKHIYLTLNLRSHKVTTANFFAKCSGTVDLFTIIDVRKTVQMACPMNLDFTSHAVQAFQ